MREKHISIGAKSGEYVGRKDTLNLVFFKVLKVKLLLWEEQLSIIIKVFSYPKFLLLNIQNSSFFIKFENIVELIVLSVASKNHKPFERIARIIDKLPVNGELLISLFCPFILQE